MLLVLLMLAACQHDTGSPRDPGRPPQTATASVQTNPGHLLPLKGSAQASDSDTAQWQELRNKWGWKIRFPKDWEAIGHGEDTPETDHGLILQSPSACYEAGERCGFVQIDSMPLQADSISKLSPREFLLRRLDDSKLLTQGETRVGEHVAYHILVLEQRRAGFPQGKPMQLIALKRGGKILQISYTEDAKDRAAITSPSDWKLVPIFEKMLSTFSFIPATCHELPCR